MWGDFFGGGAGLASRRVFHRRVSEANLCILERNESGHSRRPAKWHQES